MLSFNPNRTQRNADKLSRAIAALEETIMYAKSIEFQALAMDIKAVIQSAVVQNFSLTFRICTQMMTHQLKDRLGSQMPADPTTEQLLHLAAKYGMVSNLNRWIEYLSCEHLTHTGTMPIRTFEKATEFLADANILLAACSKREDNERRKAA